jgi:hypothetical protein
MKKLTTIKKEIERKVERYIDRMEKKEKMNRKNFNYDLEIIKDDDGEEILTIIVDGGYLYAFINEHYRWLSADPEDYVCEGYFCSKTANEIFGIKNYDWDIYASYRIDIYGGKA